MPRMVDNGCLGSIKTCALIDAELLVFIIPDKVRVCRCSRMVPISSCKDAMASRAGLFLIDYHRHSGTLLRVPVGLESVIPGIIGFA